MLHMWHAMGECLPQICQIVCKMTGLVVLLLTLSAVSDLQFLELLLGSLSMSVLSLEVLDVGCDC